MQLLVQVAVVGSQKGLPESLQSLWAKHSTHLGVRIFRVRDFKSHLFFPVALLKQSLLVSHSPQTFPAVNP